MLDANLSFNSFLAQGALINRKKIRRGRLVEQGAHWKECAKAIHCGNPTVIPKNVGMDQNAILSQFSMQSSRALMFTTNQICHGPCAITLYFFVNKLKIFTCFIHRGLSADRHQPIKSVYCYAQLKTFEISSFSLVRTKETLNYL